MQTCSLLVLFIFATSCNGQDKTPFPVATASESKTIDAGQSKLIKTRGTGKAANICCALQDKAGNLWFGTTGEGVYRYDGKSFTNFTVTDGLSSNNIGSIVEDKNGNLWFGTNIGVCRYDPHTAGTDTKRFQKFLISPTDGAGFIPFDDPKNAPNILLYSVMCMMEDKTGNLWIGTLQGGVYRYDPSAIGKGFTNFLPGEVVRCLFEDKTGNIWLGSWDDRGVYRYDPSTAGTDSESFINVTTKLGLSNGMICCITEDKSGNLWIGTRDQGVYCYHSAAIGKDARPLAHFLDSLSISSMLEDKAGNIWFGTDEKWGADGNGVYRYNPSAAGLTNFTTKDGLSNNNVITMIEDKAGNIWFGTRDVGLCRYDPAAIGAGSKAFVNFAE